MRFHFAIFVPSHKNRVCRENRAEALQTFVGRSSLHIVGCGVHLESSGEINAVVSTKVFLAAERDGTARRIARNREPNLVELVEGNCHALGVHEVENNGADLLAHLNFGACRSRG